MNGFSETFAERFYAKVGQQLPSGCIEWKGNRLPKGYGYLRKGPAKEGKILAHRAAFLLKHGDIPEGRVVMHKCDNPSCVNPDHLMLGTQQDNVRDMVAKNRHSWRFPRPWQKLSKDDADQVRALRSEGWTQQAIAERFRVSRPLISLMLNGKLQYA